MKQPQTLIRKPFDNNESETPEMNSPSLTEPHYEKSCDLGHIIAGHVRTTGQLPTPPAGAHYLDLTKIPFARELAKEAQKRGLTSQEYAAMLIDDARAAAIRSSEQSDSSEALMAEGPASQPQDSQNP